MTEGEQAPAAGQTYFVNPGLPEKELDVDQYAFTLDQGWAQWSDKHKCFFVKYEPPDPKIEINTTRLKPHLQQRFKDPNKGSRTVDWNKLKSGGSVKVHRGAQARALRAQFANRVAKTRWHEKWKDMGEDYNNQISAADLAEIDITQHVDANSRWIMLGFSDSTLPS